MTGQELIDWIREHKAEEYNVCVKNGSHREIVHRPRATFDSVRKVSVGKDSGVVTTETTYYIEL